MSRILVIDDDDDFREVVKFILEFEGHTIFEAGDGDAGINAYRKYHPDLVITDVFMPNRDGLEAIEQLHKLNPEIKIIAMSGELDIKRDWLLDMASDFGAHASICKPFKASELNALVSEQLGTAHN